MPCNYRNKVKAKFPLPEYPQEGQFDDPVWYERAIERFSVDCAHVFAKHEQWVDRKVVADIVHASKAAQLQAEEDKKRCEAEEAKAKLAQDVGECPKKWGQANTVGSLIAETSTSRAKKALKVCAYCAKQGGSPCFIPFTPVANLFDCPFPGLPCDQPDGRNSCSTCCS